jgi:hypothetical protein
VQETFAREDGTREWQPAIDAILREGCLARRILRALKTRWKAGENVPRAALREVYGELSACVAKGEAFVP